MADGYAKSPVADQAAYEQKLAETQALMTPEMNVLEFGCGTGTTALHHAQHVKHVRATDISERMIEIAREKAQAAGIENVDFDVFDFDHLDVPDGAFDMVLGMSILHLVDDPQVAIAKAHRLLKPGGYFITSTACLGDTMGWFGLVGPIGHFFGLIPKVKIFKASELVDSIQAAGFEIETQWQKDKSVACFVVAKKAFQH